MVYVDRRTYHAIKNSLTPAERELISCYELYYTLKKRVPTREEVTKYVRKTYPTTRQTSIDYYLNRPPVIKALEQKGIPYLQHSQEELTSQQVGVAHCLANFADERSNAEKLDSMGINAAQYRAWLQDPQFQHLVQTLSEQNLKNINPVAVTELTKKIQAGDWAATKFYLETTGALKQEETPQTEVMLKLTIEVIQRHVKDPDTLMAIAQDLLAISGNKTLGLPSKPAVEGEVLDESFTNEELSVARKQIGFG